MSGTTVVMEWPGRLALVNKNGKVVIDSINGHGSSLNAVQFGLSEILLEDTLDGFLTLSVSGVPMRLIGRSYPDPLRKGEYIDAIELATPPRSTFKKSGGPKQYWFDTATGQLQRVVHPDDQTEIRVEAWQTVQGNSFPAKLVLYEKGAPTQSIAIGITGIGPALSDGIFDGN